MINEMFRATYRSRPVVIGQATAEELTAVTRNIHTGACRDCLARRTLVAIRDPGRPQVNIHALGWRLALQHTWITSRLVAVDPQSTSNALTQWGFENVKGWITNVDPRMEPGACTWWYLLK